jgi:plastocyanin
MEQTFFYVVGIVLVLLAVAVSALGLRDRSFPGSRGALAGGLALFVLLVATTTTAAVISARDEQETRENEEAAEAAEEAEAQQEGEEAAEEQTGGVPQQGGGPSTLELSAPEDGSLAFEPSSLEASAGEVTIEFTNPAAIDHDVYIEQDGEDLAESELVADGESTTASAELDPGEYTYYCSVPGHREGGMEGTLTVD